MPDGSPAILVIEDEAPIRKFLRVTLDSQGYRVIEATNGREGLLHAARNQPDLRVDLLHRNVSAGGKDVHLTPNEFKLLAVLVRHAGKVLTHQQLLKEVW